MWNVDLGAPVYNTASSDGERIFIPTPRYLCEYSGKVVVTIEVDASGHVTNASENTASTTVNKCLIGYALDYARQSKFTTSNTQKQTGTITFLFEGKRL